MEARNFFIDTQSRGFVASPNASVPASDPIFYQEDVESINLYFLRPTGDPAAQYDYVDYSANTVKFAVGTTTPSAFQLTWSAISTGVTIAITTLTDGGAGANEVQKLTLSQVPVSGGFALVMPSRNVTVSSVSAGVFTAANHGLFDGQSVGITGFSFTGSTMINGGSYFVINRTGDTFSLANTSTATTGLTGSTTSGGGTAALGEITTPSIAYNATPSDVEQAFVSAGLTINGAPQIAVSGSAGKSYTLAFGGGCQRINYAPLTVAANTLAAAPGLAANVNFNTVAISSLISAGTTAVIMEVEVSDGAKRHSYQQAATLANDIISSSSPITSIVNATTNFSLNSQNGSVWNITIDNDGNLTASKV